MKRVLIVCCILVFLLTACSANPSVQEPTSVKTESSDSSVQEKNETSIQQEDSEEEELTEEAVEESIEEEPIEEVVEEEQESDKPSPSSNKAEIEETVLLEEEGIRITAKSLDTDAVFGPELKLLIENDSDQDLIVQCNSASVNGYMVGTMMSVDVANGKKANDALTFMTSDLEKCGITTIADMEIMFRVFDSESWDTYLDSEPIKILTSAAEDFTYTFDDSGDLAFEDDEITIRVLGLVEDEIWGPSVRVSIQNKSDRTLTVQTHDVSVNGFMVDPMFSCDVNAGKWAVSDISFLKSDLESNDITAIESLELSFHIFNWDSWDQSTETEVVTIDF